jgi:radical SAM protein with 4Fe4S-binding SPASM domain
MDQYMRGETVLETLPSIITIPLTTYCNYRTPCLICDRNVRAKASDCEISLDVINAARPLIKTAKRIYLHGGGEPMFSKYFKDVVNVVEEPFAISFATNAMLLTKRMSDLFLEKRTIDNLMVSLDAATPDLFRIMRPSGDFETVIRNISYLTGKRDSLGLVHPTITLMMIVCQENLAEVPAFVDLASRIGALQVIYGHLNNGLDFTLTTADQREWNYKEQQNFSDPVYHDAMVIEAYEKAKVKRIAMFFVGPPFIGPKAGDVDRRILDDLYPPKNIAVMSPFHKPLGNGRPPCTKPWDEVVIQPDGDVRLCCYIDINRWKLGNVLESDFMEIWNSRAMIDERTQAYSKSFAKMCLASQPCYFRESSP